MWHSVIHGSLEAWRMLSEALITSRARPENALRENLARMKAVLSGPRGRRGRRREFRRAFTDTFHLAQMARGVLWVHWGRLTPAHQRQFLSVFTDLLERLVAAHLRQLRWVTIVPISEVVGERSASVTWKISMLGSAALLEYRLQWRHGRWKICDALVNGHSFVAACREDFDHKIRSSSVKALVAELPRRHHAGFLGPGSTLIPTAVGQ